MQKTKCLVFVAVVSPVWREMTAGSLVSLVPICENNQLTKERFELINQRERERIASNY